MTAPVQQGRALDGPSTTAVSPTSVRQTDGLPEPGGRFSADPPAIVPLPQDYSRLEGTLSLPSLRRIVLGRGTTDGDRFAADLIREELRELNVDVTIDYEGPETSDSSSIVIRSVSDTPEDGYRLGVSPTGALIEGRRERGRFYGAMSMLQLIRAGRSEVPALRVVDFPEVSLRGILDDVSGQIPTLQEFKRVVRFLAEHKMNVYALPVEEMFRFEADRTAGMGTVSAEELVELQDFAASLHLEIIPVFRTLGHFERLLRLPEFERLAEFPGAASPNTQDSRAYELMETLLDEIVPVFRSRYIHIGGAESAQVGVGGSAGAVEVEGAAAVHLRHYRRIYDLVSSRGKDVMMNADLLVRAGETTEALRSLIPPDVILIDTEYAADRFPSTRLYEHGSVLLGPALRRWGRIFPDADAAISSLSNVASEGLRLGADGSIAIGWTADGAPLLRGMQYREYAYAAEFAWNPGGGAHLGERFNLLFFGLNSEDMQNLDGVLARLTEGLTYPMLWHHPLHRDARVAGPMSNPTDDPLTRDGSERLIAEIENLQTRVVRGADRLDYDAFAARMSSWFSDSIDLAAWMIGVRNGDNHAADLVRGSAWARRLAGEARSLAQAFRLLWLRTNRDVHLDRVQRMYQYQAAYLARMAETMSDSSVAVETTAPSAFIHAENGADTSYTRTTFSLDRGQIADGYLQVTGRNDVEVWLNGDRIGRAIGTEWAPVEVWNVASRLRSGTNVLAARAVRRGGSTATAVGESPSMDAVRPGTANIYLEIHYVDGRTRLVVSNQGWKATDAAGGRWHLDSFSDATWPHAAVAERPPTLTMPMFDRGLPSRMEARSVDDER